MEPKQALKRICEVTLDANMNLVAGYLQDWLLVLLAQSELGRQYGAQSIPCDI
jgi:hypothetical protein